MMMSRAARSTMVFLAAMALMLAQLLAPPRSLADTLSWTKTFNGAADGSDFGSGIAVAADHRMYVAGTVTTVAQGRNLLVQKYSPAGARLWSRTYNGAANGQDTGAAVAVSGTGVYVAGSVEVGDQDSDLLLQKYTHAGSLVWTRTYGGSDNAHDSGNAVAVGPDGGIYVAGTVRNGGRGALVLRKYSASGALLWNKTYTGGPSASVDGYGVAVGPDGRVYVSGERWDPAVGWSDLILRKYTPSGALVWNRTYDAPGHWGERGYAVTVTPTNNVYVTGDVNGGEDGIGDVLVQRYSSSGALSWSRSYAAPTGDSDFGLGVAVSPTGNVYAVGVTNAWETNSDLILRKYSSSGSLIWSFAFKGAAGRNDWGRGIAVDGGVVYVVGSTEVVGQGDNLLLMKFH